MVYISHMPESDRDTHPEICRELHDEQAGLSRVQSEQGGGLLLLLIISGITLLKTCSLEGKVDTLTSELKDIRQELNRSYARNMRAELEQLTVVPPYQSPFTTR